MIDTTGIPVPSYDPRVLDANAIIFDRLMMDHVASVLDRMGVPRKTWWQMEQDASALVSPNIAAIAAAGTPAANKLVYYTGTNTAAFADFPAQARTLLAATTDQLQRTALGIPWAGATTSTAAADANLIATTSVLGVTGSTLNVPAAFTSGSMISTDVFSSNSMMQLIKARTSDTIAYRRMVTGTWQAWSYVVMGGVPMLAALNNAAIQAIASAATVSIAATTTLANTISVTGTTTITSLGAVATTGIRRRLIFAGALTLTHNASSLIIPGAANVVTAAGDVCDVESVGVNQWRVCDYFPASGQPLGIVGTDKGGTGIGTQTFANLTLANSWTLLASRRAGYQKIADKMLYLELQISGGTSTDGTTIATLPAGFRPPNDLNISCCSGPNTALSASVRTPSIQIVASTGVISCSNCSSASGIFFAGTIPLA